MKKKLIAVLLAGSMLLGSVGPAPVFAMAEGEATFSEMEGIAGFDDGGADFGEEMTTDFESGSDEENPFLDGSEFLDEQEELPRLEEVQIQEGYAPYGEQAPTSVYKEGASFGRQTKLDSMKGSGTASCSYGWNWASPESSSYYVDGDGKLHIVAYNKASSQLYDGTVDNKYQISGMMKIKMPLPIWGGFYAAPDGHFYVVVGQSNHEESTTKTVVRILKYDRAWKLLGSVDVPGGISNMFQGIYEPFDGASLRMTQTGNTLIVHTGRKMFQASDGLRHQSNITFVVNTSSMTLVNTSIPYSSHSFNQFVVSDGNSVYYLDHGDAYERALEIKKYSIYGNGYLSGSWHLIAFPFMGEIGENYTGCEVTGFAMEGDTLITIGKSLPHYLEAEGVTGWDSSMNQNVFMLLTNKNTGKTRYFWLTHFDPNGKKVEITEPKLVKVGADRYAVLFSEETGGKSVLHYGLIDTSGNMFVQKDFEGVTMQTDSQPIAVDNDIYWVSGKYENGSYGDDNTYLYKLPVVTVPITGMKVNSEAITVNEGEKATLSLNFEPADTDDVRDVEWKSSNTAVASVSSSGVVTGNGYGSATITAVCGKFTATCKVTVKIPVSDAKLARPSLKLSQTRGDKIHLSWGKITGAKGYQVYYKTSPKASYKRLDTVKGAVIYDASAVPGKTYYFKVRAYGTDTKGKTKYSSFSSEKYRKAIVPVPSGISCKWGEKGPVVSWKKLSGVTGYVVYRNGKKAASMKYSQTSWTDTKAVSSSGSYWVYDYYVKAYRKINGKYYYSKPTKSVDLYDAW